MIGLDFVKNVDKDWKKGAKCRQEDCSFWNDASDACAYVRNEPVPTMKTKMDPE